jgi:hypothetical protein
MATHVISLGTCESRWQQMTLNYNKLTASDNKLTTNDNNLAAHDNKLATNDNKLAAYDNLWHQIGKKLATDDKIGIK